MIVRLAELAKKDRAKANYIRQLQVRGKIKKIIKDKYVCYDTEEHKEYTKNVKIGRPIKGM